MKIIARYRATPLLQKLLGAMILGVVAGHFLGEKAMVLDPLAKLFLNLLKMGCIPLVMANLIAGIASLDNPDMFGRIGGKAVLVFLVTASLAALLGVAGGMIFEPGKGLVLDHSYNGPVAEVPSIVHSLLSMVPDNIFASLSTGNLAQVVLFSAFLGIAILFCKDEDRKYLVSFFSAVSAMLNRLIGIVMGFAPVGIFALIAGVFGKYGSGMVGPTFKYVFAVLACMFVYYCFYWVLILVTTGRPPKGFLKKTLPVIVTAASTTSTMATLPINLKCAEDVGMKKSISSFVIPLGSQLHKDGNAIMLTISLLFAAQAAGITMSGPELLTSVVVALILTTGSSGIPGGGLVTIAILINAFSMPVEAVAIISGVFFLLDMANTAINCYGTLVCAYIVDASEKRRANKLNSAQDNLDNPPYVKQRD
ncbi:dicarboxylate/amino acid:cation symporter [Salmonella enterica]|nr:dicarboxylate/amino acid:cation symporter [Salmonella enterica]